MYLRCTEWSPHLCPTHIQWNEFQMIKQLISFLANPDPTTVFNWQLHSPHTTEYERTMHRWLSLASTSGNLRVSTSTAKGPNTPTRNLLAHWFSPQFCALHFAYPRHPHRILSTFHGKQRIMGLLGHPNAEVVFVLFFGEILILVLVDTVGLVLTSVRV